MVNCPRILITPGEPAGIGPDVCVQIAQSEWSAELVVIADPQLLQQRASQLGLPLTLIPCDLGEAPAPTPSGTLKFIPILLNTPSITGQLNTQNAAYVLECLETAAGLCLAEKAAALVTGPVHKEILNAANIPFSGHTEFFAHFCQVPRTVMLFVVDKLKIALATTHLPLAKVPESITQPLLTEVITILQAGLQQFFKIASPHIAICGLNPHAGEGGYLGREEIEVIAPTLAALSEKGYQLTGPLPADTAFTEQHLANTDAVLAMYHDQALPLVKYLGFDRAVNVTLGLPFIRTSVDHGTALEIAGTGKANPGSMRAALELALFLQHGHR